MNLATGLVYDIRFVTEAEAVDDGLRLQFRDGSAGLLDGSHRHFELLHLCAKLACGKPRPVGVMLDTAGGIVDLNTAYDTHVQFIEECPDRLNRLKAGFWGFSTVCYLTLDHPEFERIRSTLAAAAGAPGMVWLANHSELMRTEPTGEEEGEVWWKIMDVRPM